MSRRFFLTPAGLGCRRWRLRWSSGIFKHLSPEMSLLDVFPPYMGWLQHEDRATLPVRVHQHPHFPGPDGVEHGVQHRVHAALLDSDKVSKQK
jgi:hypothetical protein